MRAYCIGDSNTYGYDPRSYLGSRYDARVRWTERLIGWEVINGGVNGLRIPPDAAPYVRLIQSAAPELVILMLGSNDLLAGLDAETTAQRLDAFLSGLRVTGPRLLVIAPPPMQPGEWVQSGGLIRESEKLGAFYRLAAERRGLLFADAGDWDIPLCFDGVHFSPEGHAAFAAGLNQTLRNIERGTESCIP